VIVGGDEALVDDAVRLVRAVGMAGIDTTLHSGGHTARISDLLRSDTRGRRGGGDDRDLGLLPLFESNPNAKEQRCVDGALERVMATRVATFLSTASTP
jgi:hypothetical protein